MFLGLQGIVLCLILFSLLFCTFGTCIGSSDFENTEYVLMLAVHRGGAVLVLQCYTWT